MKIKLTYKDWSDEELLQQYVTTSRQELLGQLYSRYIPLVYGLCLKYLRQQEDAEDAVMQIYEELQRKVVNFEIANFRTWLYSVAKNHCLQILRRTQGQLFQEIDERVMESDGFEHLIDTNEDIEKDKALNYCLDTLSAEQKVCVVHFFFDDWSYADIVEKTGYALTKVKSYIQNGKRNLKLCMVKILDC
ncbi:MAG: sigma-70 family RNA polymerase sigma factor [Bacteroidota bacterium]|nr:sigma-70 family RNA polymerase sigma factor [Bacteroidota bacterium]